MIKSMKKIAIVLVIALAVALVSNIVCATDFLNPNYITATNSNAATSTKNIAGTILGIVQVIGIAVAVIMLVVLAIKYISAAPSDKAEIKKHAVVYIVGAIVLFAASGILQIIKGFAATIQ